MYCCLFYCIFRLIRGFFNDEKLIYEELKKGVKELEEEITELKEDEEEILNQDAGILVNF